MILSTTQGKELLEEKGIKGTFINVKLLGNSSFFYIFDGKENQDLVIHLLKDDGTNYHKVITLYQIKDKNLLESKITPQGNSCQKCEVSNLVKIWEDRDGDLDTKYKISDMTIADFAAILWKIPVADKKEINNLINYVTQKSNSGK